MQASEQVFNQLIKSAYAQNSVNVLASLDGKKESNTKYAFSIDTYSKCDVERQTVETFIKEGFYRAYEAKVSITMPTLLAVKNGAFKAALGIRSARSPLFVEQYFDDAIENIMASKGIVCERDVIAEIGHLYSNTNKFALPLLLSAGVSLFLNRFRFITFCATPHVKAIISNAGINLVELGTADKERLTDQNDNWGSYYHSQPSVVAISTLDIINTIHSNPKFLKIFNALSTRIKNVSVNMAGL